MKLGTEDWNDHILAECKFRKNRLNGSHTLFMGIDNCYTFLNPTWINFRYRKTSQSLLKEFRDKTQCSESPTLFLFSWLWYTSQPKQRDTVPFGLRSELHAWTGTAAAQWLRRFSTNLKVAGSIPAGVIGIFHWHKILPIALWPWGRLTL